MKNNILIRIMYTLLLIAVVVVVVCGVMVVKNTKNKKSQEAYGLSMEEVTDSQSGADKISVGDKTSQAGMGFDSYVSGSKQIKEIAMKIEDVPVIIYFEDTFDKKPLLILQHGITSKKEEVADLAKYFTKAGYVVVTPDAAGHGEAKNSDKLGIAELIKQTGENFDTVISYFEECEQLAEAIKEETPYEKLMNNSETCFFLLCGNKDDVVPHEGNLRFYDEMKDKTKDIVLRVKENQKHEVTEDDLKEVFQYLKGHL